MMTDPNQLNEGVSSINIEDIPLAKPRIPSNNSLDDLNLRRKQLATDSKTSTEYTLHILFTQFVRHAERKLNICLQYPLTSEPPIVKLLSEGVDPNFDQIIASLGRISKSNPKPVIDSVMFWRKSKSEVASMATDTAEKSIDQLREYKEKVSNSTYKKQHNHTSSAVSRFSHRRNNSSKSTLSQDSKLHFLESEVQQSREIAIQADRKSLISIYILCRVLIEVVKQSNFENTNDLGDKLEEIVFSQLRQIDPILISSSIIRSANWNLFAELLGYMSERRFLSVSDRFIADLEKIPSNVPKEIEPSIHLLIHGMRYLKLKNYPLEDFEECADFLQSIAKFFKTTRSHSVKIAYSQVLTYILLPLAESLTAEVNHPTWSDAITSIFDVCSKIDDTNKNWLIDFTLATSTLCVAPNELFLNNWFNLVDFGIKNIKLKAISPEEKAALAQGISRLIWVYIYRCTETLNNTTRKIDTIIKDLFFNTKKPSWLSPSFNLITPLVEIFKTISYKNHNQVVDNYLLPILKQSFNGSSLDGIQHEKVVLAVKSYVAILCLKKRPKFPESFEYDIFNFDVNTEMKPTSHEEICKLIENVISLVDFHVGHQENSSFESTVSTPTSASSFYGGRSPFGGFKFGSEIGTQLNKSLNIELLAALTETVAWTIPVSTSTGIPRKLVEQLVRNSLHEDDRVASASSLSLKLLAAKKHSQGLINSFAKYAFNFSERSQYQKNIVISKDLLKLYLELLEDWLESISSASNEEENSDNIEFNMHNDITHGHENQRNKFDELEIKNTITIIEEVEGHGLFFLAAQDFEIRRLGLDILRITEKFDEALYESTSQSKSKTPKHSRSNSKFAADIGTRVIFILQSLDFVKLIGSQKQSLSVAERSRITKLNQKQRKSILTKLAESDYGVDSALWFKVFPGLLATIFEKCPITMAICRSIVCTRLVQIHEPISQISSDFSSYQKIGTIPAEALVEQWKLYLIVASISLTSTTEQRISIPETGAYGKSKKSKQLLTIQHSTITSARSVFRLTLNLLSGSNQNVKDAIIAGLSCMNINIFKTFVEAIDPIFEQWTKDIKTNRNQPDLYRKRIEITHILNISSKFMEEDVIIFDDSVLNKLVGFVNIIKEFLSSDDVQNSFEFQKLRRYFCGLLENVFNGIQKRSDRDTWFPFEARVSCFAYLEEWCGYGKSSIISKNRYANMARNIRSSQELAALNSAIEFERQILTVTSLNTMVCLLNGPIQEIKNQTVLKFDLPSLLSWIDLLWTSDNERIYALAKKALKTLFKSNGGSVELFNEAFKRCINDQNSSVIENYYVVLASSLIDYQQSSPLEKHKLLVLALYGVGFNNLEIRSSAIELLIFLEKNFYDAEYIPTFKERVKNKNKIIYKRALLDISTYLASSHPEENLFLVSELTLHFHTVSYESRRDILTILLPWLQTIELKSSEKTETDGFSDIDASSYMILINLFEITMKFSESIPNEIEALWIALGNGNNFNNTNFIIQFALHTSLLKRNSMFVEISSKIFVYLYTSNSTVADILISYIDHKSMVPPTLTARNPPDGILSLPYVADVWPTLAATTKESVFSAGQLSLIFLADLLTIPKESFNSKIPILLHSSFVLLDHYLPIVQESAGKVIVNIMNMTPSHPKLEETMNLIKNNQKFLWVYDDLNNDKNGARSPKDMDLLVRNALEISGSSFQNNLQQEWGKVALSWAVNCAVRHIACRSFQVFRSLLSFLDQSMLKDMLQRLSNTISDESPEIQGFAMQILMTLNAIVSELDAEKLIDFPQLFWATVASLNTINEHEYIELLSILTKFLSKIDLDSEDTVSCLVSTFPTNWQGKFEGLQQIIMIGLRSASSFDASLQLLDKMNKLKDSNIIADDSRLLFALLANLPRYLHALDDKELPLDVLKSAEVLGSMAKAKGQPNLERIIDSFSKARFRTKEDFLRQTVNFICEAFLQNYTGQIVIFLLGLLTNKIDWIKIQTMAVLKILLPKIDLAQPQFQGCGADLISPLLRLLLTPYAGQALDVLSETANIPGSKLDKDILRMSLGNRAIRKDYDKTATLFGIPEDSGWSIPMPAITAATTRNNVHAVFSTCLVTIVQSTNENDLQSQEETQIQFHLEEYQSGRPRDEASLNEENGGSLSHMWAELDNLDSFFTKDVEGVSQYSGNMNGHNRSVSVETTLSENDQSVADESAPQIYDKKVSVILNRSLARTHSNTSFKTSLADSFGNSPTNERHLSTITSSSVRDSNYHRISRISSPTNVSRNPSAPASPILPSARENSFRFEGLLAQESVVKPKKKLSRFSQAPEYLSNWTNSAGFGHGNASTVSLSISNNNASSLNFSNYSNNNTSNTSYANGSDNHESKTLKSKSSSFGLNRDKKLGYFNKTS
ncbi:hypothetical protein WICMUC_002363 [Wickerhamomyces mucosus]|uniref:Uncharacterized protein n=1 Tax=Wickerhamomyces mucosus TaxID=1378264 RepID=A0A9P8TEM8_9ASCO|nr:hypothetical protein WICMUC_002363 [Wickerhamomyces mucosus]